MKMASPKFFLLCGLLLAALVLMTAQVSARDLAEETQSQGSVKEVNYGYVEGHGSYGHGGEGYEGTHGFGDRGHGDRGHGGRGHGGRGHGGRGGHPPEETEDVKN